MSLPNGKRLARCSGPVYGPFGTSFRAEGYGFLSVSHFPLRLHKFCNIEPTWRIQLMTDNLGLLTRVEKSLPHPDPFPNMTLKPDWDVTNKIVVTLQAMTFNPILAHIKGHQDDHAIYEDLPLTAQLNVNADKEAGYYQSMYPAQRPIIPRLPSNRVQLHIANQVISLKVKQTIRDAFTVPPYKAYLQRRNNWSQDCMLQSIGRRIPRR
jgi:hypothetical protein